MTIKEVYYDTINNKIVIVQEIATATERVKVKATVNVDCTASYKAIPWEHRTIIQKFMSIVFP